MMKLLWAAFRATLLVTAVSAGYSWTGSGFDFDWVRTTELKTVEKVMYWIVSWTLMTTFTQETEIEILKRRMK